MYTMNAFKAILLAPATTAIHSWSHEVRRAAAESKVTLRAGPDIKRGHKLERSSKPMCSNSRFDNVISKPTLDLILPCGGVLECRCLHRPTEYMYHRDLADS